MKYATIYTRFSPRPGAATCDSCEKQLDRCRAYCHRQNYVVFSYHSDEAISGGVLDRPGLSEALAQLTPGMILVIDSGDRLARDMLVSLTIRHEIEKTGATIEYADGSPNTTTPEGELFTNILAAFAQYERSRISLRTKRGIAKRQANGEWFGKPPVGWMRDLNNSKKLVENQHEQKAMESAKQLHKEGFSSETIALSLTDHYGSFRGNPWSARTIRRFLQEAP